MNINQGFIEKHYIEKIKICLFEIIIIIIINLPYFVGRIVILEATLCIRTRYNGIRVRRDTGRYFKIVTKLGTYIGAVGSKGIRMCSFSLLCSR